MKRGQEKGELRLRKPRTNDGRCARDPWRPPRAHTAEKMYIHADTAAKDMVAVRRSGEGVDWCFPMPRMLPPLLQYYYTRSFISHGTIFVLQGSFARRIRCSAAGTAAMQPRSRREVLLLSLLFFYCIAFSSFPSLFHFDDLVPFACCMWRTLHVKLATSLIAAM